MCKFELLTPLQLTRKNTGATQVSCLRVAGCIIHTQYNVTHSKPFQILVDAPATCEDKRQLVKTLLINFIFHFLKTIFFLVLLVVGFNVACLSRVFGEVFLDEAGHWWGNGLFVQLLIVQAIEPTEIVHMHIYQQRRQQNNAYM